MRPSVGVTRNLKSGNVPILEFKPDALSPLVVDTLRTLLWTLIWKTNLTVL